MIEQNQAQQTYDAIRAAKPHVTQWYGELSDTLKVSVSRSGAIIVNVPGHAERFNTLADFAAKYGIRPTMPPLECPIEKALLDAYAAISRMAQRQQSVAYDHSALWGTFDQARKELKRLKKESVK